MFAYHRSVVRRVAAFAFLFVGAKSAGNSNCFALPVTFAFSFTVAITDAASEPASVGRGNFFSWTAFRSRACDRGD
jgi:hypothetical protein